MSDFILNKDVVEFQKQWNLLSKSLWPVLKGSVALVHKPCVRKNCPACARGDKHPSWIYTFSDGKKRRCMYIPEELVPLFQQGLENGRKMERFCSDLGPLLLKAYRKSDVGQS